MNDDKKQGLEDQHVRRLDRRANALPTDQPTNGQSPLAFAHKLKKEFMNVSVQSAKCVVSSG